VISYPKCFAEIIQSIPFPNEYTFLLRISKLIVKEIYDSFLLYLYILFDLGFRNVDSRVYSPECIHLCLFLYFSSLFFNMKKAEVESKYWDWDWDPHISRSFAEFFFSVSVSLSLSIHAPLLGSRIII